MGSGSGTKQQTDSVVQYGKGAPAYGTAIRNERVSFEDQLEVQLFNGNDRVRLPRQMLPAIHGGDDGWFKVTDIHVSDRNISAKVMMNFLNHPKLQIDRVTGRINITGNTENYSGSCRKFDQKNDHPQF